MKCKTIAITGATSMLGIATIKECIANNYEVLAFVRPHSSKINRLPVSNLIRIIDYDLDSLADYKIDNLHADVFIHFGWAFTDKVARNDCRMQLDNVKFTLDAVAFAKELGCKKFIGVGSQAEYGIASEPLNESVFCDPLIPYGMAKYIAGKMSKFECMRLGLEYNWVRVLSIYGKNDNEDTLINTLIKNCKENIPMDLSPCTHIWDYLFETDAGKAFIKIAEKGANGKIYCLGSGKGMPLMDYIRIIISNINPGYTPNYGAIPYSVSSVKYLVADISELTKDTGWRPEISFFEGAKKIIFL